MTREERRRARAAYARRNAVALLVVFGAAVAFGLWRENLAAVAGGAAGVAWVLWALRQP